MEKLKLALAEADDDYLTGITNKGILKRSYKDLETAKITANFIDDSAYVSVDNVQCVILTPIADSSCTCPSRTICRHIITAVLWLKNELLKDEAEKQEAVKQDNKENKLQKELEDFPVDKLRKAMKKKYFNSFLEKAKIGILPSMEELSTITVDIPEDNTTVKLLSPLEYSACTCFSKGLCKHKAVAVLAWKLKHKVISIDSLVPVEDTVSVDTEKLHFCAEHCIAFLSRLLSDGLVRTPEDASEYAEAAALICHNAGFPEGEKSLREIGNRLKAYISHSPQFSTEYLFSAIIDAYLLMRSILGEKDPNKLNEITGEFRSSYKITDELELIPLAQRKVTSMAGYEGDVYYFVNKSQSGNDLPFLTFSDIRPTYYDNNGRSQMSNAPWGLYGLCNVLMSFEMRLTLPKLSGIKLSSSSDTKAVQICKPNLDQKAVYDKIYTDFRKLINENFANIKYNDRELLVMLMPEKIISSYFSETEQTLTIVSEDYYGQRLNIKARYQSKTKDFFEQLVAAAKTMLNNPDKKYVIFGNAYIESGQCSIYPIAVYDKINVPEPSAEKREKQNTEININFLKLFKEISGMLCDIIQCGINLFDLYVQINNYADECETSGLIALAEKLRDLSEKLSAKNHTYSENNTEIIRLIGEVYDYLQIGTEKTEVRCAIDNLYTIE